MTIDKQKSQSCLWDFCFLLLVGTDCKFALSGHSAVILSYACPEFLSKGRRTFSVVNSKPNSYFLTTSP